MASMPFCKHNHKHTHAGSSVLLEGELSATPEGTKQVGLQGQMWDQVQVAGLGSGLGP